VYSITFSNLISTISFFVRSRLHYKYYSGNMAHCTCIIQGGLAKVKPLLFLISSLKHWPILTIFGTGHREDAWRKFL